MSGDRALAMDCSPVAIKQAGNVLLLEETQSDVVPLGDRFRALRETYTLPLPELKAAALGSAPFVLPTRPISVGQFWTFGRASDDTPSLAAVAVQAHLLVDYEAFISLIEAARPGSTADWPRTRAAVQQRRELELTMKAIRRAFQTDGDLRAAAESELAGSSYAAPTARAMQVLLDLYAGARQPLRELLRTGSQRPDAALRSRARRVGRFRHRREDGLRRPVRAAAGRAAGRFHLGRSRRTPAGT